MLRTIKNSALHACRATLVSIDAKRDTSGEIVARKDFARFTGDSHETEPSDVSRPKIGLALSGGGARGAAHISVLRVLEENNVPIDYIAGTSMGSIVGGLYSSGMTPDEIEAAPGNIDWDGVFDDRPPRTDRSFRRKRDDDLYLVRFKPGFNEGQIDLPQGLVQGQKIDLELSNLIMPVATVDEFDNLMISFRVLARRRPNRDGGRNSRTAHRIADATQCRSGNRYVDG